MKGRKLSNGLFQVKLKPKKTEQIYLTEENEDQERMLWHRKFGHTSLANLKKLATLCDGLKISRGELEELKKTCQICEEAKQSRKKFGESRIKATRPLQIIHTDVCGPIDPVTWNGKRYILTCIDDYTHYTMAFLLEYKTEVVDKIKEYVQQVEAYWNLKVSKLRCDNGKEFLNKNMISWCKKKGIIIDNTLYSTIEW